MLKILCLYGYPLELLTSPISLMIEINFMSSFQALVLDWYVEKTKSSATCAEFYKHRVLSI